MNNNSLGSHSALKRAYRWMNISASVLLITLFVTHVVYASYAHATSENWEDHIFVVDSDLHFKALNPLAGNALGYTIPFLSVGYVNREATERLEVDWEDIQRHEAKHVEQIKQFGLLKYYQLETWKREGLAEYVRGEPTLDICNPPEESNPNRLAYREYYIVTRYLIDEKGLSEDEVYAIDTYPIEVAESWVQSTLCNRQLDAPGTH